MAFRSHLRYRPNDVQSPVHHDSAGNVKNIAIRGSSLEFGDGARADASGAVAIGPSVVNATASSVALGSGSATPFIKFSAKSSATEAAGAATVNATAGKVTLAAVLNAGAGFEVTITNSYVSTSSVILLSVQGTTATAAATRDALTANITSIGSGSFVVQVYNGDAGNSTAAPVIHFLVV